MEALMNYARFGVLLAMVGFTACSDNALSPRAESSDDDRTWVHGGGASQDLTPTSKYVFPMTIDPKHNTTWDLGAGNKLTFPRGSLCEPTKSSYGVGEWDKPCVAATRSITLTVSVWVDSAGHPRVDFEPSVRFVPSLDSRNWVILQFADLEASLNPFYNINYCPTATSSCFNEAKDDPSLATVRDPKTGKITRRVKHFSGYNVAAGDELSEVGDVTSMSLSLDDLKLGNMRAVRSAYVSMTDADAVSMFDRIKATRDLSGYILASGQQEQQ
jgi:hypothetical protein